MTYIISAQFLKKIDNTMVSAKMSPIPPFKMGSVTCQCNKKASRHSKEPGLKKLSKTFMKVELKGMN
jgi:hypothetical protein